MTAPTVITRPRTLVEVAFADASELDLLESQRDDFEALADFLANASPSERAQMRACLDAWWLAPVAKG